jgi:hypothetical protein
MRLNCDREAVGNLLRNLGWSPQAASDATDQFEPLVRQYAERGVSVQYTLAAATNKDGSVRMKLGVQPLFPESMGQDVRDGISRSADSLIADLKAQREFRAVTDLIAATMPRAPFQSVGEIPEIFRKIAREEGEGVGLSGDRLSDHVNEALNNLLKIA